MAEKKPARLELHMVKYTPPPADLPVYGSVPAGALTVMGRSTYVAPMTDEQGYVFGILEEDRAAGVHVLGRAGSGKTKLLESMARQDLAAQRPFVVLDASGDLVTSMQGVAATQGKDVVVIGEGYPDGIDLLPPPGKEFEFADTLAEAAAEYAGTGFDPKLRRVIAAHLATRPASMDELAKLLAADPAASAVSDLLEEILAYPTGRAVLGGGHPATGTILAYLPPAELGFSRARALAQLVADAVIRAHGEQRLLPLYVDGLEILGGRGGLELLRDMKAVRIAPVLAHRMYADVSDEVLSAISATIGTEVAFRLSGEDASRARNEFSQTFDVRDFLVLSSRQCYVRLSIRGELREPFSAETLPLLRQG